MSACLGRPHLGSAALARSWRLACTPNLSLEAAQQQPQAAQRSPRLLASSRTPSLAPVLLRTELLPHPAHPPLKGGASVAVNGTPEGRCHRWVPLRMLLIAASVQCCEESMCSPGARGLVHAPVGVADCGQACVTALDADALCTGGLLGGGQQYVVAGGDGCGVCEL